MFWKSRQSPSGKTAAEDIFAAIERGDIERCRALLQSGATTLKRVDPRGLTPLHVAAEKRQPEIVKWLLAAGADPKARDSAGATPLHWAAIGGDLAVVAALLESDVDVDAVDNHNFTPAQLAQMRGHTELARLFGPPGGQH